MGLFIMFWTLHYIHFCTCYPPASQASREVTNLTERKNLHTLVYGVKEFVHLSVCLLQTLTPNIQLPFNLIEVQLKGNNNMFLLGLLCC